MSLPNVKINIGNGNLGRVGVSTDGVAGLILTGSAVADKLQLNKVYSLSGTRDIATLGITADNNVLLDKEVRAFYAQAGEGAELHIIVVSDATTLTSMCDSADGSALCKLIDATGGRVRIVGVNKMAAEGYEVDSTQGIDADAITAAEKAQATAENYASKIRPFRLFLAAPAYDPSAEKAFKPREASYNRVAFVLASDDPTNKTAAVGMVLGRAAKVEPQQSITYDDGALKVGLQTEGLAQVLLLGTANEAAPAVGVSLAGERRKQFGDAQFIVFVPASVDVDELRADIERFRIAGTTYAIMAGHYIVDNERRRFSNSQGEPLTITKLIR